MFTTIGRFVVRTWIFWILAWAAALVILRLTAPSWMEVASEGEMQHLPASMPTRIGQQLFERSFPNDVAASSIVVVLSREPEQLQKEDFEFVSDDLTPALREVAEQRGGVIKPALTQELDVALRNFPLGVQLDPTSGRAEKRRAGLGPGDPRSPKAAGQKAAGHQAAGQKAADRQDTDQDGEFQTPESAEVSEHARIVSIAAPHNSVEGPLLVSQDWQAMVVTIGLTHEFLSTKNIPLIRQVERAVEQLRQDGEIPDGLEVNLTGSAVIGRDVSQAVTRSTETITRWTPWIVLVLLVVILRAPIHALIALGALFCSVQVSLDLMAVLAGGGYLNLFDGLKVYASVLIYGAGVDYSLFLISRFTEELGHGESVNDSLVRSMTNVGSVVVISAATEIFAIGMLSWSRFGKFVQSGQSIPLGLAITLAASMTLTFALLRLFGRRGSWPRSPEVAGGKGRRTKRILGKGLTGRLWQGLGNLIGRHPVGCWLATVLLLSPLCALAVANSRNVTYDMVSDLPPDAVSFRGNTVLKRHFSPGITGPITVLLRNNDLDFGSGEGIQAIESWGRALERSSENLELADLRSVANPLGTSERLRKRLRDLKEAAPNFLSLLPDDDLLLQAARETSVASPSSPTPGNQESEPTESDLETPPAANKPAANKPEETEPHEKIEQLGDEPGQANDASSDGRGEALQEERNEGLNDVLTDVLSEELSEELNLPMNAEPSDEPGVDRTDQPSDTAGTLVEDFLSLFGGDSADESPSSDPEEPTDLGARPFGMPLFQQLIARLSAGYYVSDVAGYDGHVTRATLVLDDDPFTRSSIDRVSQLRSAIRDALPESVRDNTVVFLLGPTASLADVKWVAEQDRRRLYVLVTVGVFLVLWLLLREMIISIYLIMTVFFTYLVTMGISVAFFSWLEGDAFVGLDWSVPLLLFTLLMAVGADYNVFLIQRFREELRKREGLQAVTHALTATGGLISGAGVVMAGTFTALVWGGTLGGMRQLGFALAMGVLIDTFVVRPVLVPAFLVLQLKGWFVWRPKEANANDS